MSGSDEGDDQDKAQNDEANNENGDFANDQLEAQRERKKKREEFIANIDENLSPEERQEMIDMFDNQLKNIEDELKREREQNENAIAAKLAKRKKGLARVADKANDAVNEKKEEIEENENRLQEIQAEKDHLENKGINTKDLKKERDAEYKERCEEMQKDRDEKLNNIREDYMRRIQNEKNPAAKEKLLEEMGRRMKSAEDSLLEEKKRSEAQLMKMLKARQKKKQKQELKELQNEEQKIEEDIEGMKNNIDVKKAEAYAEKGSAEGLVDKTIQDKKEKISKAIGDQFTTALTQTEKDDIEIHKNQLLL